MSEWVPLALGAARHPRNRITKPQATAARTTPASGTV